MPRIPRIPGIKRIVRIRPSSDVDDELRFHIDAHADDLIRRGMAPDAAEREALRAFGDWQKYHDETSSIDRDYAREARMKELISSVWSDVAYALRGLRRNPAFAFVATTTLALGIGATVAVFGAVSGVVLRPLQYPDADRIVHLGERETARPGRGTNTSAENAYDWQRMSRSFQAMGMYSTYSMTMTGVGSPVRVGIAFVTPGMFDVFHVRPALGRALAPTDTMQGAPPVILVSHDFWRSKLGSDPDVVGRSLQFNFQKTEIVGVLPADFRAPDDLDKPLWGAFVYDSSDGRGGRSKNVFALLRRGVSVAQAQHEMTDVAKRLEAQYPRYNRGSADVVVGDVRRPLYLLLGASMLVLLIACANISNLLVARGIARAREVGVRAALGAGRARIARQLLTESIVLSVIGSAEGVALAYGVTHALTVLGPDVFELRPPQIDVRVLAFSICLVAACALIFGAMPALRAARNGSSESLRASSRVVGHGSRRTRSALAIAQLSLAVVLLTASALVIKSFARVLQVQPGIRTTDVVYGDVWLPRMRYDSTRSIAFYAELERRLRATPGVVGVGMTSQVPFSGYLDRVSVSRFGGRPEVIGSDAPEADRYVVTPGYFATMGVKLLKGRLLSEQDRYEGMPVAVVDEVFARRAFGSEDPIGQTMQLPLRRELAAVVGVVSHVKTYGLDVDSPGQIYMSNAQYPWRWLSVVVHTSGNAGRFAPTIARVVQSVDRDQPLANVGTIDLALGKLLQARRFALTLLAAFALSAIVLAAVGLYGVIAYGVSQRRRELGVRVALGAEASKIARMVLGEGVRIAVVGVVIGVVGAIAIAKLLASLLFEVSPRDPLVLAGVSGTLVIVALVASALPALRAARIDAAEVLRGD